ncbi:hypothetical protein BDK51DRAFT_37490 [Blyttiomyces helicus]|uniref:Uncharacterized protein n=1 Tax=Blyttiomyces helicus TaxID=388810 RepID=A0A4P9W7B6_9FUNG|nr:hypothetical protein BDK51DRAFT_37490 [Blyttiomyces helicus]|eukprot:RKO88351.1 hypothetical protein BDK51DRAFT_37490 [Blyttiomyces helicus]
MFLGNLIKKIDPDSGSPSREGSRPGSPRPSVHHRVGADDARLQDDNAHLRHRLAAKDKELETLAAQNLQLEQSIKNLRLRAKLKITQMKRELEAAAGGARAGGDNDGDGDADGMRTPDPDGERTPDVEEAEPAGDRRRAQTGRVEALESELAAVRVAHEAEIRRLKEQLEWRESESRQREGGDGKGSMSGISNSTATEVSAPDTEIQQELSALRITLSTRDSELAALRSEMDALRREASAKPPQPVADLLGGN